MYHLIRRIHLFTGLILLMFVIMYFATGYVMIHHLWFGENKPKVTTRTEALNYSGEKTDAAMSVYLQETFGLAGNRVVNRRPNGTLSFNFVRPGTVFEAVVAPDGKQVKITRRDQAFVGTMATMHELHGYGGGWFYSMWALVLDLASASMVVFAITGIILWYQSTTARLPGWICLGFSTVFTAAMIFYLLYRK